MHIELILVFATTKSWPLTNHPSGKHQERVSGRHEQVHVVDDADPEQNGREGQIHDRAGDKRESHY
jgi:hypothetical protein